jgi:hypothetical protein
VPLLASHPSGDGDSVAPRPVFAESGSSFFPEMVRRRVDFSIAGRFRTVVLGDWKLIWTPGLEGEAAFELHDLGEDPGEEVDLSATHPVETERLRQLLFAWLRAGSARSVLPPAPLSEDDAERLRALGYISD